MSHLGALLQKSAERHRHRLCPRQVLGVRIGIYASELLEVDLPQEDKRVHAFLETDGCLVDGVEASTGCSVGRRTMHLFDYGKSAVTFVDTVTERCIRISSRPDSRQRALTFAPNAPDRWHAQLEAYQIMPADVLLQAQEVALNFSLRALISRHGRRIVCESCGEDIINERQVCADGQVLCRACAVGAYYSVSEKSPSPRTNRAVSEMAEET